MRRLFICNLLLAAWCCAAQAETFTADQQSDFSFGLPVGEVLFVASDVYTSPAEPGETSVAPDRQVRADNCYQQARALCEAGEVAAALQWAQRALFLDPDHEAARRVLGYRRIGNHWAGSYAARRMDQGEIWHSEFGWIAGEDVARYESGERRLGKRWVTAEEDARRHAAIERGWQIRTDHFRVVTNHDRRDASRLAIRLETLYQLWRQLFADFYLDAPQLRERFDGQQTSGYRSRPFHVVYYQSRQEYNEALLRHQPKIGMTLGIYFDTMRKSHFFAGPEQDPGTIDHEAVHQLFQESARSARDVASLGNAWALEGVACYFESLARHEAPATGPFFTIGTTGAGRLPAARHRRLVDEYYVPLEELASLGMTDLQQRQDLARLYSQSAGLATFLMHGRDGQYRPALVELLKLIYTGRDQPGSLAELAGCSFAELDRQYGEFLQQLPPPADQRPAE